MDFGFIVCGVSGVCVQQNIDKPEYYKRRRFFPAVAGSRHAMRQQLIRINQIRHTQYLYNEISTMKERSLDFQRARRLQINHGRIGKALIESR